MTVSKNTVPAALKARLTKAAANGVGADRFLNAEGLTGTARRAAFLAFLAAEGSPPCAPNAAAVRAYRKAHGARWERLATALYGPLTTATVGAAVTAAKALYDGRTPGRAKASYTGRGRRFSAMR